MITALDHVVLAVADFEAAVVGYEALLGRQARRTEPANGAVRAWFKLGDTALEVIAPAGEGVAGQRVRERLAEHGEGPSMLAFAVADLDDAGRRLKRRGLDISPVQGTSFSALAASTASTHGVPMVFARFETFPAAPALGDGVGAIDGLDHVVILTPNPERAVALYGGRLGLDLRLDRSQPWGARQLFFRCGGLVVEVVHPTKDGVSDDPDRLGGFAWRTANAAAAHARLSAAGFAVSDLRGGRKPGTRVFTVKDRTFGAPTIVMDAAPAGAFRPAK
jgi:catechol 2,3-dioxygenase-like lactoylglutathione lyase family enzyme